MPNTDLQLCFVFLSRSLPGSLSYQCPRFHTKSYSIIKKFYNYCCSVLLSLVAGGRGEEKRMACYNFTESLSINPLRDRLAVNYRYQETFGYKICISSLYFPPPSTSSSLLLHSTHVFLNYCRSSSLPVPGGPRQNKGDGVHAWICVCVCSLGGWLEGGLLSHFAEFWRQHLYVNMRPLYWSMVRLHQISINISQTTL